MGRSLFLPRVDNSPERQQLNTGRHVTPELNPEVHPSERTGILYDDKRRPTCPDNMIADPGGQV